MSSEAKAQKEVGGEGASEIGTRDSLRRRGRARTMGRKENQKKCGEEEEKEKSDEIRDILLIVYLR